MPSRSGNESARRQPERSKSSSYLLIYKVVRRIPRGKVASYGQIARIAGFPGHARRVGYALYNLPTGSNVPWHRVVNAAGALSVGRLDADSGREQRLRLELEGVAFDARGRVRLDRHGWKAGRQSPD
jgi:methylated-DNA-protein-cysteine methyltransferase-like protein